MKVLGLIGGISWVSTIEYYKLINEGINEKLGGLNFSRCIIHSFNYADIKKSNDAGDFENTYTMVYEASKNLVQSGAQAIVLCANTMHLHANRLQHELQIPLIHIAEATSMKIREKGLKKVGLLGTKLTMEMDFYTLKLAEHDIEAVIPDEADRAFIHYTIFEELGRNMILNETKLRYLSIIDKLVEKGAEGIILGCTEIPLLLKQNDIAVPSFDTTQIHAAAAVAFSLGTLE